MIGTASKSSAATLGPTRLESPKVGPALEHRLGMGTMATPPSATVAMVIRWMDEARPDAGRGPVHRGRGRGRRWISYSSHVKSAARLKYYLMTLTRLGPSLDARRAGPASLAASGRSDRRSSLADLGECRFCTSLRCARRQRTLSGREAGKPSASGGFVPLRFARAELPQEHVSGPRQAVQPVQPVH